MTYAVSASDLMSLASPAREAVMHMLRPFLTIDPISATTQRGVEILLLVGQRDVVRRAILLAHVVTPEGKRLRFYAAYAPGLWDEMPCFEAIVRMRVQEYTDTGKGKEG